MAKRNPSIGEFHRKTEKWRDQFNPLRGLTITRAVSLLEAYRRGEFADLQWLYSHIEESDATLLALVERRTSSLIELDWDIRIIEDDDLPKNATREQAEAQRDYLQEIYGQIDNLREAIEFLALATFRGFAHVQKQDLNGDGIVDHLEVLDQWNWVRDGMFGQWFWNPKAQNVTAEALRGNKEAEIEPAQFIIREVPRHLDRIALIKYVRTSLAEKDWTAFVEIYGIPGGVAIMPPNVPDKDKDSYLTLARDVAEGGNGVLAFGGDWKPNDGPRGVNPFRDFLRYLDEKLVLAGTGGLLTMLAESGSGTLAGNAHQKTFEGIARAEGRKVSELFQKQFDRELLAAKFGDDAPVLAYFELNRSDLSEEEIKFLREVFMKFQADGTVGDIMANLTNLRKLAADVGLSVQEDYEEPWLPILVKSGLKVTGEVVRDSEEDIVGGDIESSPDAPQEETTAPAALKNRNTLHLLRKALAAGISDDLKPLANRLVAIEKMADGPAKVAALENFLRWIEEGRASQLINRDPKAATVLETALRKGFAAGVTEKRGKK